MAVEGVPTFHWADYLVLGLFLAFNTALGLFFGIIDRKQKNSKSFLLGGGDMHYIPVALSMQASFLSAIFIISTPTEIYNFGTLYSYLAISYWIGLPIAAYMYLPTYRKLKLTSAYEYLEIRFNRTVRLAGALTFSIMVILYMAVVLYTPAIAIAQVTGLTVELSISICGVVCVVYTVLGGMKATIWNDFIQMLVIVIGLTVLIILGAIKVGDFWAISEAGGRIIFNEFNPDPTIRMSFWTQTVGGTFVNLTLYASSQTIIQKFLSIKKQKNAQKSMWVACLASTVFLVLVCLVGLVMYAFYETCDPVKFGKIQKSDQLVSLFIMEVMGDLPGLPGLLIAACFSAALSSVSGSLNALSAVFLVDFIKPFYKHYRKSDISERASNIISRSLALGFGLLTIVMGFLAQFFGDLILQMALSIFGFVGGPLNGLLTLGIFIPFVNKWGALAGLITSLGITSWIAIGTIVVQPPVDLLERRTDGCPYPNITANISDYTTSYTYYAANHTLTTPYTIPDDSSDVLWVYKVSYMYYSVISMIVALVVGVVVSLITDAKGQLSESAISISPRRPFAADVATRNDVTSVHARKDLELTNHAILTKGPAKNTPSKLTYPWAAKCCCYCPRPVKSCLRCGSVDVDDDDDDDDDDEDGDGSDNNDKETTKDADDMKTAVYVNGGMTSYSNDNTADDSTMSSKQDMTSLPVGVKSDAMQEDSLDSLCSQPWPRFSSQTTPSYESPDSNRL